MGKKLSTDPKSRDDVSFNPFMEVQKIIGFQKEAAKDGSDVFTVFVKDGFLMWMPGRIPIGYAGFIAVIDNQKFGDGLTTKGWRKLEEKVAIEMCKQRKEW